MREVDAGTTVVSEDTGGLGTCESVLDFTGQGGSVIALVDFREGGRHWVSYESLRAAEPHEVPR